MKNKIKKIISESIDVKTQLMNDSILLDMILEISDNCVNSLQNGGKIIFCGNGGSFADAQHLSAEFTSRFLFDREGLASIALGTNSSAMSAIGNDYGFNNIFSRQIIANGKESDVFLGISTSGDSQNIIEAFKVCKDLGIKSVLLTGRDGGKAKEIADISLIVPDSETIAIQEAHLVIEHSICELVEKKMLGFIK